ncbi:MAG: hypothetical protein WA476_19340 [Acidobacteriaceae bacterium]
MRKFAMVATVSMAFSWAAFLHARSLEDLNFQIHGYATQGFLYTTQNNIFYANSSDGSPAWTEAVVNLTAQPGEKLRFGIQARYQLLGSTGNAITLDWAAADYKVNDRFGVRFGKVKTPWGLFNETQDIDPSYMWALLPQSIYDITTRDSDLSHYGGVAYGKLKLPPRTGKLEYRFWGGEAVIPADDGQFADLADAGTGPLRAMSYVVYGAALYWDAPVRGLMFGASNARANQASVALNGGGTNAFEPWDNLSYFGKYEKDKVMLAVEWNRQAAVDSVDLPGASPSVDITDPRGWYAMGSYKLTPKLAAGVYDSQFFDYQAPLGPDRYSKDWTVGGRYDFSQFLYLKAEEHFIQGTALSFEDANNPVLRPSSHLTAIKIGVSF